MRTLWTFENQAKVDLFVAILQEADISYETLAKGKANSPNGEVVISVAEREYEQAKKLLMKYRKRRTTT